MKFRCDIEGLRGFSIVIVFLFHYYPSYFVNGVYGVDILFVISGFVITNSIYRKEFTICYFYQRRINRLYPAAYICLCWILSDKIHFYKSISLLKDIQSASIYIANIRFYKSSVDYFNSNLVSPVLHFWSLSIENQFYALYPIIFIFFYQYFVYILIIVIFISFHILCKYYVTDPEYSYFIICTRIWELLIGCLSFIYIKKQQNHITVSNSAIHIYLLLLILFVIKKYFIIPGPFTLFPVLFAVTVCVNSNKSNNVFNINVIRFFGRISYSLYLYHYPLLSFSKKKYITIIISLIISIISYNLVELTFQKIQLSKINNFAFFLYFILLINYIINKMKKKLLKQNNLKNNSIKICNFIIKKKKCFLSSSSIKFMLIGDSHIAQYIITLEYIINKPTIFFLTHFWQLINNEKNIIESIVKPFKNIEIIFSSFLIITKLFNISNSEAEIYVNKYMKMFKKYSNKVIYIQDNPYLLFNPVEVIKKGITTFEIGKNASSSIFSLDASIISINPFMQLCPSYHICSLIYNNLNIYIDTHHLNIKVIYMLKKYIISSIMIKPICNHTIKYYWCDFRQYRGLNNEEKKFIKEKNISVLHHFFPYPVKYVYK